MFLSTISAGGGGEDAVLRAMFAARKRVFVDLLKWDVPVLAGQYEVDQFDDPHATYLVLTDADGAHLGSARLLDTERQHILDTLFPELSDEAVPSGPRIREITCLGKHAPTPLAASGLDMRAGHPAAKAAPSDPHARFSRLGAAL